MERTSRAKKASKAAVALDALRAVRAGERKALDVLDSDDEAQAAPDEQQRTLEDDDGELEDVEDDEEVAVPSKRKQAGGRAAKEKAKSKVDHRAMDRMNAMWANASAKKAEDEGDDLLEELLNDMDSAAPPKPRKKPTRGPAPVSKRAAPAAPLPRLPPASLLATSQAAAEASEELDAPVSPPALDAGPPADEEAPEFEPPPALPAAAAEPAAAKHAEETAAAPPAAAPRMFADDGAAKPAPGPAAGWSSAMAAAADEAPETTAAADVEMADGAGGEEEEEEGDGPEKGGDFEGETVDLFVLDAHYEPAQVGTVFLIGKVARGREHESACVAVSGVRQTLFFVPKPFVFQDTDGDLQRLEEAAAADPTQRRALLRALHGRCAALKAEARERLSHHCKELTMKPVKRDYAFEDPRVPRGQQWVLKVTCDAAPGAVSPTLTGANFVAVLGTQQTPLEAVLLKRSVMGPSWLRVRGARRVDAAAQSSWCKEEYTAPSPKCVDKRPRSLAPPPLRVAALNVKTIPDAGGKGQEVVVASVVHTSLRIDGPTDTAVWRQCRGVRRFSAIRRVDGAAWPVGLQPAVQAENDKAKAANGGEPISMQGSERALLSYLLARLHLLDPDLIIGHNIGNWDLNILLLRMQQHKVLHWSRVGRMRRVRMPNLVGGGGMYGGGASNGVMTCFAGRLLVDTYVTSRDLLKEVEYSLASLASKLLGQTRTELHVHQVRAMCEAAPSALALIGHAESDAWLALGLAVTLSVVPLTLQLSKLSGFLWARTLQGNRAQRIEMLLLREFHRRKFLLPDRLPKAAKTPAATPAAKKRASAAAAATDKTPAPAGGGDAADEGGGDGDAEDAPVATPAAKTKGPQYAGGLVLEPKKGIYSKCVLLLDFNSLYPSIIQEYNICFTTVARPADDAIPPLPAHTGTLAPLPFVIQGLVQQRRAVKASMKRTADPLQRRQLDIRQQALKLTANSMYGCLGFAASRFYAKPLAQLITCQGREILQSTVALVQGSLGLEVIYGDTDSIMIATGTTSVPEVLEVGARAKAAVNKHYKLLEIDIDGVFKSMLLLKKKKYAAVKLEAAPGGGYTEVLESKGLDIVRRDWCPLARALGRAVLELVLSGREQDDIVEAVHAALRDAAARVTGGHVELAQFAVTKQLTKRPEEYPDAKAQAHVQVALRMRARGAREGTQPGDTVQYVICKDAAAAGGAGGEGGAGLASRAHHPQEVLDNANLQVDTQYYLSHQLHPVVARLCAPLEATSDARLAECLGLDPTRFRSAAPAYDAIAEIDSATCTGLLQDDDDRFVGLAPLQLAAPDGTAFPLGDLASLARRKQAGSGGDAVGDVAQLLAPPGRMDDAGARVAPAQLANQATLAARAVMRTAYDCELRADDDAAPCSTRDVLLATQHPRLGACAPGCCPPDASCQGHMAPVVSEADAWRRLDHIVRQVDVARAAQRCGAAGADAAPLAAAAGAFAPALASAARLRDSAAHQWASLADFLTGI